MTVSHTGGSQLQPPEDGAPEPIPGEGGHRWPIDRVVRVGPGLLMAAAVRLVSPAGRDDADAAERFLGYAEASGVDLGHFYARLDDAGAVTAAALAVPSPGRTAMIFANRPSSHQHAAETAQVIRRVADAIDGRRVSLAQALLEPNESLERLAFEAAGFRFLARLSYLQRAMPTRRSAPQWSFPDGVCARPYAESIHDELLAILDATYEDTLDCPGLVGLRRTEDILAGHRETGRFEPSLWTLLYEADRGVGLLLLNPSQHQDQVELVYMGLVKSARGRGLGRSLLRHGLSLLAGRRERSVVLAVDEANGPAVKLYRGEGFRTMMRRSALVRAIETTPP